MKKQLLVFLFIVLLISCLTLVACGLFPTEYKLQFMVDGEVYKTISGDSALSLPENPTKDGYTFDGWYYDNGTWQEPFSINSLVETGLTQNITVYAKWIEDDHIHSFADEWSSDEIYHWHGATCCNTDTVTGKEEHNFDANDICTVCYYQKGSTAGLQYKLSEDELYYIVTGILDGNTAEIVFPATYQNLPVTTIAKQAFEGDCLKEITIPDSIVFFDEGAFSYQHNLIRVNYTGSIDQWAMIEFASDDANPLSYADGLYINDQLITDVNLTTATKVGKSAFNNYKNLTSVTIGDSVAVIESSAFYYCYNLASVSIPNNVPTIHNWTFEGCDNLICNEYNNGLYIGNNSNKYLVLVKAKNTDIDSCIIHESTKAVCSNAFNDCNSLTSVTFEESSQLVSIGSNAFDDCTSLASIIIPDSVTSIGSDAFYDCTSLTSITIGESIMSIGDRAFYDCENLTKVDYTGTIDQWVMIEFGFNQSNPLIYAKHLFIDEQEVTEIELTTATKIGRVSFHGCISLTSVTIPESVSYIGYLAFSGCENLTRVNYAGTIEQWAMIEFGSASANPLYYANNLYINNQKVYDAEFIDATKINDYAFYNYSSLSSITIPESIISIGDEAFSGCFGLEEINVAEENLFYRSSDNCLIDIASKTLILGCKNSIIPEDDSVIAIGDSAFQSCFDLTSIKLPQSLTAIGSYAFEDCTNLTSLTIPENVTTIGSWAFYNCTGLTEINIDAIKLEDLTGNIFANAGKSGQGITVNIGANATRLPEDLFCDLYVGGHINPRIIKVIFAEDSVCEEIGSNAFRGCNTLTSIEFPSNVTSIGGYVFYYCVNLTSVVIPDSVKSIGDEVFGYCDSLKTVYYRGTAEQWSKVNVGSSNNVPSSTTLYFYSETAPATDGNYWHYVDGVPTVWIV